MLSAPCASIAKAESYNATIAGLTDTLEASVRNHHNARYAGRDTTATPAQQFIKALCYSTN